MVRGKPISDLLLGLFTNNYGPSSDEQAPTYTKHDLACSMANIQRKSDQVTTKLSQYSFVVRRALEKVKPHFGTL
jgi:hypothetical protein